jgi:hypothetical protein
MIGDFDFDEWSPGGDGVLSYTRMETLEGCGDLPFSLK